MPREIQDQSLPGTPPPAVEFEPVLPVGNLALLRFPSFHPISDSLSHF
jgi:hypothetical protein